MAEAFYSHLHIQRRKFLRKKHSHGHGPLPERIALTEVYPTIEVPPDLQRNYCGESLHSGGTLTVGTYTNLPTSYDDDDDFSAQLLWTIEVHPPYLTQFMNSMFVTYTERGNAFELLSIAALPASPWRPDHFGGLDSHLSWHTSPLSVLITGYDVGVR